MDVPKMLKHRRDQMDDLIAQFPSPLPPTPHVHTLKNLKILVLGFTGDVGGAFSRHLSRLNADNQLYVLVRQSQEGETFEQRFRRRAEQLALVPQMLQLHPIQADYSKPHLGVSDKDWAFLTHEIDLVVHCGARASLNLPWKHAEKGILEPTRVVLEFARTYRIKPVIYTGSSITRVMTFEKEEYGLYRGYCLGKYIDYHGLRYYNRQCGHPIYTIYIGYAYAGKYCKFYYHDGIESLMFCCLKSGKFPTWNMVVDWADLDDMIGRFLEAITKTRDGDFTGRLHTLTEEHKLPPIPDSKARPRGGSKQYWEWGVYSEQPISWDEIYHLMKLVRPDLQRIHPSEMNDVFLGLDAQGEHYPFKYLSDLWLDGHGHGDQMNAMMASVPSGNLPGIRRPSTELILRMFRWMMKRDEFTDNTFPHYGWDVFGEFDAKL